MATAAPGGTPGGETGRARRRRTGARVISLLSDYGLADGFVGALHSVLRTRMPQVAIVDLTHEVRPQDVRAGSLALKRAAPYLAPGVVVAIVDPGVGTTRRPLAVQAAGADLVLIGPDNGLLVPALEHLGGAALAVVLENPAYRLASPGPTFAGRDIFAPAAAHLAGGGEIGVLGREVGPGSLVRLPAPVCRKSGRGTLEAEVTWVDRYGNVQLSAGPDDFEWQQALRVGIYELGVVAAVMDLNSLRCEAADAGNPTAMANLGNLYLMGRGVPRDYEQALAWYRKAAELGSPAGERGLGYMYLEGLGVPQDVAEARRWLQLVAQPQTTPVRSR